MGEQEINLEQEAVIIQSGGGGAVDSVNGQTGDVVLTTSDLENTSDYQTGSEVESAISEAISELPTVNDATLTIQKNGASVGTFTANDADNTTINITVPTTAADVSALPVSTKYGASLSLTIDNSTYVVTAQLKDQDGNNLGSAQTVDLPLESVVVNGSYDSTNKKIVLTLQNGNTIDIPVADLVSGLQTEITSDNKLSADLVDDTSTTNKFVTASEKATWNAKQDALTAGANITIEEDSGTGDTVISATDTTYSDFVGTDGVSAGTAGLVPAPATTDAGKFLKADGTWDTAGGGGGDTVYSTKTTSNSATGGAVYIGNLGTDQTPVQDPSPNDNHYKYFWALPSSNNGATYGQPGNGTVNILGSARGQYSVSIGLGAGAGAYNSMNAVAIGSDANAGPGGVSIGNSSGTNQDYSGDVCIGQGARINTSGVKNSISLGYYAQATRTGELNIGVVGQSGQGFNSTNYRVIGGVHDGQDAHDAVNVNQVNSVIDAINTALSTNIPHIGA